VSSEVVDANIVDVPDSDNDNNNNYVDLDTIGAVLASWEIAVIIIVFIELDYILRAQAALCDHTIMHKWLLTHKVQTHPQSL